MKDLAGFRVGLRVVVGSLIDREPLEHRERHPRVEPQALHGCDEAITPERRRVPWDSRVGVRPLRGLSQQDCEVRSRTPQHYIEHLIGGFDLRADPDYLLQFAVGPSQAFQEWRRPGLLSIAGNRTVERNRPARLKIELERSERRRQMGRRRLEHDTRAPPLAVETEVDEIRSIALDKGARGAAPRALDSPDLENVGEIAVESDRKEKPDPIGAEISHDKTVKQGGPPNEHRPCHMQQVLLQDNALVVVDVGIGEIDAEDAAVVGEVRPQEEGLKSVDQQLEMREIAGVAIEQAVRPTQRGADVAVAI